LGQVVGIPFVSHDFSAAHRLMLLHASVGAKPGAKAAQAMPAAITVQDEETLVLQRPAAHGFGVTVPAVQYVPAGPKREGKEREQK
jgi:hypothetical protein